MQIYRFLSITGAPIGALEVRPEIMTDQSFTPNNPKSLISNGFRQIEAVPADIRGVGISVSKLGQCKILDLFNGNFYNYL